MASKLQQLFPKIFSYDDEHSYVSKLREKRMTKIKPLLEAMVMRNCGKPVRILDIGGGYMFWKQSKLLDPDKFQITLMNINKMPFPAEATRFGFTSIKGDACRLDDTCKEYDVAFSNSVIEHVGGTEQQELMAKGIQKHFDNFIVQTPNFWFPFEPHSHLLFFQFIPHSIRALIIYWHGNINWFPKENSYKKCIEVSKSIRMLTRSQFKKLFPDCVIMTERMLGIPKSYMAIRGFNT